MERLKINNISHLEKMASNKSGSTIFRNHYCTKYMDFAKTIIRRPDRNALIRLQHGIKVRINLKEPTELKNIFPPSWKPQK
jgi:hypothetical protein